MAKFYLLLWLHWAMRLSISTLLLACGFSFAITIFIYAYHGFATLNSEVYVALFDLFQFWFPIMWSAALLLALFRSLKFIFNSCNDGFMLRLTACGSSEVIEPVGYGDLVRVWRKWFMLIIWLVGAQMIVAIIFTNLFTSLSGVFEWFNIYWLFTFVLMSGYFSFILLGSRCKRVKVVKC
jgi:hypothetical protein